MAEPPSYLISKGFAKTLLIYAFAFHVCLSDMMNFPESFPELKPAVVAFARWLKNQDGQLPTACTKKDFHKSSGRL